MLQPAGERQGPAERPGPLGHSRTISCQPAFASQCISPRCQRRGHEDHYFYFTDMETEALRGEVTLLEVMPLATLAESRPTSPVFLLPLAALLKVTDSSRVYAGDAHDRGCGCFLHHGETNILKLTGRMRTFFSPGSDMLKTFFNLC